LNIRIDDEVKHGAQEVLDEIGLSLSGAVSIYFKQIALQRAIPFRLTAAVEPDDVEPTPELAAAIAEAKEDMRRGRNLSKPMDGKEALRRLKGLRK